MSRFCQSVFCLGHPLCAIPLHSYSVDLVVCSALGVDMYDCVFPTRTAVGNPYSLTRLIGKTEYVLILEVWDCTGTMGTAGSEEEGFCD